MFYVIRDDYGGYEFEIVAQASDPWSAFDKMCMDVARVTKRNDVMNLSVKESYNKDGLQVWADGALLEDTCRWGITYWKGDK